MFGPSVRAVCCDALVVVVDQLLVISVVPVVSKVKRVGGVQLWHLKFLIIFLHR